MTTLAPLAPDLSGVSAGWVPIVLNDALSEAAIKPGMLAEVTRNLSMATGVHDWPETTDGIVTKAIDYVKANPYKTAAVILAVAAAVGGGVMLAKMDDTVLARFIAVDSDDWGVTRKIKQALMKVAAMTGLIDPAAMTSTGSAALSAGRLASVKILSRVFGGTKNARKVLEALKSVETADFDTYDELAVFYNS